MAIELIDKHFELHIQSTFTLALPLIYGSAEGQTEDYYVMVKVFDPERPFVLCKEQGESGKALFQFYIYRGGAESEATNAALTLAQLQLLKEQVKTVKGLIGTSPNQYRIHNNITSAVLSLGAGDNTLSTWGAVFESIIWWEFIS